LSENTRELVHIYGKDKSSWRPKLLEEMDGSELTEYFGGRKEFPFELEDYRQLGKLPC
jgi:hypothetical protein